MNDVVVIDPRIGFDPEVELHDLVSSVLVARVRLSKGEEVDIEKIRQRSDEIITAIPKLPPAQARANLGLLTQLIHALDEIESLLAVRFNLKLTAKPLGHPSLAATR